jgi:hypothetical protein
MNRDEILTFARRHKLAVEASSGAEGPQAAVVGVVFSDRFEVFFDTLVTSRKCANLRRDPHAALVVGWDLDEGRTLQIEGTADEPAGDDLARLKALYFSAFPDGLERERSPDITYFRVRPAWMRYSDFTVVPGPFVVELGP